ncbi:MAG TPA: APC family permease [Burkholderiaceae bacterium]|nr:APC family permease [Burkholderiaceae bacterium]
MIALEPANASLDGSERPAAAEPASLRRAITWVDAFWVSSGVPALLLFTIGAMAASVGNPSWAVWIVSIVFGFLQSFTYAEIAGLFPHKSGGASIYGAIAWVRYGKLLAPISVWCNWIAWSPVLALGVALASGYILSILFAPDSVVATWSITLADLGWIRNGLTLRVNANVILADIILLIVFSIQHRGILSAARAQMIFAISSLLPLVLIGLVPLITGDLPREHFSPFVPLAHNAAGDPIPGAWTIAGFTVLAGGMALAGWTTYGFETAVCYTREFRNPARDTFRAILSSACLCLFIFTLVPVAFQGAMGLAGMLDPGIYSGMGVARAMAKMVGASGVLLNVIVVLLVMTLLLSVMTAMAGSSRTLYQGSIDGWLPRYLGQVNHNGAPTRAMWTDLTFNLLLLMLSDNIFILAASNVAYMIFVFMNLNAGWIHRIDRPDWLRPFKAPNWLLATGAVLGYINLFIIGMGSDIWGPHTLISGLVLSSLIIPVFIWRHYVVDKGVFPPSMIEDMHLESDEGKSRKSAGVLPYLALAGAALFILLGRAIAVS